VIAEIDIWRAAYLMLRWYSDTAQAESLRRIGEFAAVDDLVGVAIWLRIVDAIEQLANTTPPGPAHKPWRCSPGNPRDRAIAVIRLWRL
jgi:hypothetical protein